MPRKSKKQQNEDLLQSTLKRFTDSYDYQKTNWHDKWERDQRLYDGERVHQSYEGVTDTNVPMVFPTVETMVTALSNASLRFDYKSKNPVNAASAAPLNAVIDEWWDEEGWDIAIEEGSREFIAKGMSAFMWSWEMDRPKLDWFAMRDAIVDPTVKRPRQLQEPGSYAGRRYFVRKGSLKDYEVVDTDPESKTYGELVKRYTLPDEAASSMASEKDDDKAVNEMFAGSVLGDAKEQQDEIIEIWDVDRVVTLMNRKYIIEDVENPYKARHRDMLMEQYITEMDELEDPEEAETAHKDMEAKADAHCRGVVPFFFFRNYRNISLLYAKSETDSIAKEAERLNDMTNMETDYIIKQLAAQKELDPAYEDWIDLINDDPSTVYPFKPGSLVPITPPVLPPNSFQNRLDIKNVIRETTGIDQIAKGGQSAPGTTATEVQAQAESTGQRIESKARILEKDGLYWMAWILFKLVQLYQTEPLLVSVTGINSDYDPETQSLPDGRPLPGGTAIFNPADYQDDWRPSISLEIDAMSKKRKDREDRRQEYQILIQDPTNNLDEIKKRFYPKIFDIDKEDLDAIITPAAPVTGAVDPMTGQPMAPPMPGVDGGAPQLAPSAPPVAPGGVPGV